MTDQERGMLHAKLSDTALLCQLAEEAAELAQAALKLRRVLAGDNPTPVTQSQAEATLLEEFADVLTAAEVYGLLRYRSEIERIQRNKFERWMDRLRWTERERT